MPKAIEKKDLVGFAKKLNKSGLVDDDVAVKGSFDDIAEDFIQAIEDIDDNGKIDKVKSNIITFYEKLLKAVDTKDDDDDKGKGKKEKGEAKSSDFDADALTDTLEDLDFKEIKKYCKANDLPKPDKAEYEDDEDEVIVAIVKAMAEKAASDAVDDDDDDEKPAAFDADALTETLEDMDDFKEIKAFCKENDLAKPKKSDYEDDEDEVVAAIVKAMSKKADTGKDKTDDDDKGIKPDELQAALEDCDSAKDAKALLKKSGVDFKIKKSDWDDDEDEVIEAIVKSLGKKDKGKGKNKGKDKDDANLPKGIRNGTVVAVAYTAIKENPGITWGKLATIFAKAKGKDTTAEKVKGSAFRTVSRKVAAVVPVCVTFSGKDEMKATFTLSEDD